MLSIGTDIEDISRFENKEEDFLKRIFTQNEIEYSFKNKKYSEHLAVRFCAKEAVVKALSSLNLKIPQYSEIEILNNPSGAPYIKILNDNYKNYDFLVSLSHEKQKAIAFVVVKEK